MPDELAARLTPDQNIRAHAFNAVAPALAVTGDWLPLSVRQRVADAVIDDAAPVIRAEFAIIARDFPEPFRALIMEAACPAAEGVPDA